MALPEKLRKLFDGDFIPVIMGPTASGKSALALAVAEEFNGEIICADSMQLYRGLDIGTAKASAEERARIPHHLIDVLDINEKADVFRYRAMAEQSVSDIRSRGRRPVFEGGSGLYLHALLYGLDDLPARQSLRDELDARYDSDEGFPELCAVMKERCPDDFARFGNHRRKLIRAYEVFLLSGRQMCDFRTEKRQCREGFRSFLLLWDREVLRERIRQRTALMLKAGWIDEARTLIARGLLETPTAWQALGYPLIHEYLQGRIAPDRLEERIATATWQYARRQLTWFRNRHPDAEIIRMPAV